MAVPKQSKPTERKIGPTPTGVRLRQLARDYIPGYELLLDPDSEGRPETDIPFPEASVTTKGIKGFHGTPKTFNKFDLNRNQRGDLLGSMVHGDLDFPNQANEFADRFNNMTDDLKEWAPQIIPFELRGGTGQALDLYNPTLEDMAKILNQSMSGTGQSKAQLRRVLLDTWRQKQADPLMTGFNETLRQVPLRKALENNPDALKAAGFDAALYSDSGAPAIAVPDPSLMYTPWGTPLGDKPGPSPSAAALKRGNQTRRRR